MPKLSCRTNMQILSFDEAVPDRNELWSDFRAKKCSALFVRS